MTHRGTNSTATKATQLHMYQANKVIDQHVYPPCLIGVNLALNGYRSPSVKSQINLGLRR